MMSFGCPQAASKWLDASELASVKPAARGSEAGSGRLEQWSLTRQSVRWNHSKLG